MVPLPGGTMRVQPDVLTLPSDHQAAIALLLRATGDRVRVAAPFQGRHVAAVLGELEDTATATLRYLAAARVRDDAEEWDAWRAAEVAGYRTARIRRGYRPDAQDEHEGWGPTQAQVGRGLQS